MLRPLAQAAAARPLRLVAALALLSLAGTALWLTVGRAPASAHDTDSKLAPSTLAVADQARAAWTLPTLLPDPIPQASKTPAPTKAASPEPDWSAFSLGVTDASAAVATKSAVTNASSPAEIEVALSRADRSRLIAAAKEAESQPPPVGYVPGIAWTVPEGSGNDGICR